MSGDEFAAAAAGAGLALLMMGAALVVVLAYAYQGAHAARLDGRGRDRARCRRYHHLSRDERRIWRTQEAAAPADEVAPVVEMPARGARWEVGRCA